MDGIVDFESDLGIAVDIYVDSEAWVETYVEKVHVIDLRNQKPTNSSLSALYVVSVLLSPHFVQYILSLYILAQNIIHSICE